MLISFNSYLNSFYDFLSTNYVTKKESKIQTNSEKEQYKNVRFYPCSTKEWTTSIYSYNKSFTKSLISIDFIVNTLLKSYFNMLPTKPLILFKRRRDNKSRYSANKIYISRAELHHTNSKLLITLHAFNKQKSSFEHYIRKIVTLIIFRKIVMGTDKASTPNHKNRLVHLLKRNFFMFKKWNIAFFKENTNLFNYSLIAKVRKKYFELYNIPRDDNRVLKILFRLQKTLFNSTKNIHFNTSIFTSLVLYLRNLGLISLLEKLYNKKVEIKLVELRTPHLNSDVITSAVALKLRDRKNNVVRILRKAVLQTVKIPDLHTLITFDDSTEPLNKNNIINTMKQQVVSGVRFEASGRLTRRLTAMRAVFKYRYAGSLKNIRSSFNNESSTMLRGYFKSNSQHTLINSKTRNGTFGLKGWISSHMLTFWLELFSNLAIFIGDFTLIWINNIIYLFIQIPLFITVTNKFGKKARYVSNYQCVYILALLTFPALNLLDLINFLINDVFPKLLEFNAYFPKDDLSMLHIVLLPIAIVMLGLNSFNKNKQRSLLTKIHAIISMVKNPRKFLVIFVCLAIFSFFCNLLGLHVIYDNSYLFSITLLCRVAFFKLVYSLLSFVVTKDKQQLISNLSLSFSDVFMILLTSIVYTNYIIPLLQNFTFSKDNAHSYSYIGDMESNLVNMSISDAIRNELSRIVYNNKPMFVNTREARLGYESELIFNARRAGYMEAQIANSRCPDPLRDGQAHDFVRIPRGIYHYTPEGRPLPSVENLVPVTNTQPYYIPRNQILTVEAAKCPVENCSNRTVWVWSCRFCTAKCCDVCM